MVGSSVASGGVGVSGAVVVGFSVAVSVSVDKSIILVGILSAYDGGGYLEILSRYLRLSWKHAVINAVQRLDETDLISELISIIIQVHEL